MISLIIDSVRLSKSEVSEQIFSEIYFHIRDDIFFPEKGWDDFSVIVMGWWLGKCRDIREGNTAVFYFMDGPFYFEVSKLNNNCIIRFIKDKYHRKNILYSEEIDEEFFLRLILRSANLLIRSLPCEAKKLNDVTVLINNFQSLQKHIKLIYKKQPDKNKILDKTKKRMK